MEPIFVIFDKETKKVVKAEKSRQALPEEQLKAIEFELRYGLGFTRWTSGKEKVNQYWHKESSSEKTSAPKMQLVPNGTKQFNNVYFPTNVELPGIGKITGCEVYSTMCSYNFKLIPPKDAVAAAAPVTQAAPADNGIDQAVEQFSGMQI